MPTIAGKDYVIGKGIAYAAKHASDNPTSIPQGFRDVGNTPGFTVSIQIDKYEHNSSRGGIGETDLTIATKVTRSGTVTMESMNADNMALLLLGEKSTQSITAGTDVEETFTNVEKGLSYQLGVTSLRPGGVGLVSDVAVVTVTGSTALVLNVDYEIDLTTGFLTLLETGTKVTDANKAAGIKVTYDNAAQKRSVITSGGTEFVCAMRFNENNPVGENADWLFPYVRLRPNGDFNFISEEVRQMEFQIDILAMPGYAAAYRNGKPVADA